MDELERLINSGNLEAAKALLGGGESSAEIPDERAVSAKKLVLGEETPPKAESTLVNRPENLNTVEERKLPENAAEKELLTEETDKAFRTFKPDPTKITKPDGFEFEDPVELLMFLDDDLQSGRVKLHPWQLQIMLDFAKGGVTDEYPFQALVRACNGSGKDKYVIAPCAVWLCMRYTLARCVVTSASGDQLDNQTDAYIYQLCQAVNRKIHPGIWKLNYRYYECLATQSPMKLFATDEPGKAEGYHPLGHGKKMAIFMSEAKSIPDEINVAINKCTGYTHRVHVSTPGLPIGHFHDYCNMSVMRDSLKDIYEARPIDYIQYHITAFQCSHLSRNYIEQCKRDLPGGETGAAYKSQVLAEFGTTDEMVVVPYTYIWSAINTPKAVWLPEPFNTGGLDLSDGGDETCLVIRNGNKHLATIPFRFDNTEDTIDFLNEKFREYSLNTPEALVFADCGGLGKPMLDRLRRQGWSNIRYVDNRNKPYQPRVYFNRGAELWFHVRVLFERREIILNNDVKLVRQLSTRYYKISQAKGTHQLLSKPEQKSKGYPSPDRADAFTLAFWNYKSTYKETRDELKPPYEPVKYVPPQPDLDLRVWAKEDSSENKSKVLNPSRGKNFSVYQDAIALHNQSIASVKTQ